MRIVYNDPHQLTNQRDTDMPEVKLTCVVSEAYQHHIYTNEQGQLVLEFYKEVSDNMDVDDPDEMGELQSDMLWECFDSSLLVVLTTEE